MADVTQSGYTRIFDSVADYARRQESEDSVALILDSDSILRLSRTKQTIKFYLTKLNNIKRYRFRGLWPLRP